MAHTYQYEQLEYARKQMRLMRVNLAQELDFEITTVDLDAAPTYFAISYTWGTSDGRRQITLNGARQQIYPNLHELLCLLHRRKETRWFWVDQICIDQSSLDERSNQVAMMRDIYSRADEVIVWLGVSGESLKVPELLLELQAKSSRRLEEKNKTSRLTSNETVLHQKEVIAFKDAMDKLPSMFQHFYDNPYWDRLWIIQELLVARKISIICEDGLCSWLLLDQVSKHLISRHKSSSSPLKIFFRAIRGNVIVRDEIFGRGPFQFTRGKCQDPRDKVYALRGLFDGIPEDVPVDYNKSVEQVFQDLVMSMFETPGKPKYLVVLMALCHEMLPEVWAYIEKELGFGRRWIGPPIGPRDYARAMRAVHPEIDVYIDMSRARSVYSIWRGNQDIWWDLTMRHV